MSKTSGAHSQLAKLEGRWKGTARTWFEPDKVADESPVSGTMKLILGGQFIMGHRALDMVVQPVVAEMLPGGQGYRVRFLEPWTDFPGDDALDGGAIPQ